MSNYGTDWQALRSDELETALRTAKAHLEWWVSFWDGGLTMKKLLILTKIVGRKP